MIHLKNKKDITEYFEHPGLSQSKLKLLLLSGQLFNTVKEEESELFFEEKEHFIIGSAVDTYITMTHEYDNEYYTSTLSEKPSATIMSIIQQVYSERISDTLEENDILWAIDAHGYQSNWKTETRITKILKDGQGYWDELCKSEGKTILSMEQSLKIMTITSQLMEHPNTKNYFNIDNPDCDIYYQLPIYFEHEGVECKALLDMVIIDHKHKAIQLIDIKTIGDFTKNFDYQCFKRRYDIQASWYTEAFHHWARNFGNYENYILEPFRFIVASTTRECSPLVFIADDDFMYVGEYGVGKITFSKILGDTGEMRTVHPSYGWRKLFKIYKWHLENGFEEDYEIAQAKGEFVLKGDFKRRIK